MGILKRKDRRKDQKPLYESFMKINQKDILTFDSVPNLPGRLKIVL